MKVSDFRILSGWIEKYKPVLTISISSWDNSYYVRLVIASLAVNIGKLHPSSVKITFFVQCISISAATSCYTMKYVSSKQNQVKDKFDVHNFKLPYISNLSHHIKTFKTLQRVL